MSTCMSTRDDNPTMTPRCQHDHPTSQQERDSCGEFIFVSLVKNVVNIAQKENT